MRFEKASSSTDKGWYAGPWNSALPVSIGYANKGIDEPHVHSRITEIYLVARGAARVRVEGRTIAVAAGDLLAIEAGEAHTFIESSPGYFHFVVHTQGLSGDAARAEKCIVPRERLGL
jgi:mannose-6-phosphate isomerase-like protein (cupin superfamily)